VPAFEVNEFRVRFLAHRMPLHLFALRFGFSSFFLRGHSHRHFQVTIILNISVDRANPAGAAVEAFCRRG
jgi:hypothetical protein